MAYPLQSQVDSQVPSAFSPEREGRVCGRNHNTVTVSVTGWSDQIVRRPKPIQYSAIIPGVTERSLLTAFGRDATDSDISGSNSSDRLIGGLLTPQITGSKKQIEAAMFAVRVHLLR